MSEAVFPRCILHPTPVVVVGYATVGAGLPGWLEAATVVLATVAGCLLLHDLLIRRVGWLRPFFGLTRRPAAPGTPAPDPRQWETLA